MALGARPYVQLRLQSACTSVPSHIWLKYRCMWCKTPINSNPFHSCQQADDMRALHLTKKMRHPSFVHGIPVFTSVVNCNVKQPLHLRSASVSATLVWGMTWKSKFSAFCTVSKGWEVMVGMDAAGVSKTAWKLWLKKMKLFLSSLTQIYTTQNSITHNVSE